MTNFFNNAQSVYINGKEVQSIVLTDNGGVLYEKIVAGAFKKFDIQYDIENETIDLQAVDSNGHAVTNNIDDIQNRITVIGGDVDGNYSSPIDISLFNGSGQYIYSLTNNKLNYCLCDWITEDDTHFRQIAWITSEGNVVDFGIRDGINATSKLTKEDHLTFVLDSAPIYNFFILTPEAFSPDDFVIRYGDSNTLGNEENDGYQRKSNGDSYYYSHTYSTTGQYDVEIYGIQNITSLNILNACILSIDLPKTIKTIGNFNANSLKEIKFNWTESQDIIPYNSQWIIKFDVMMIVPNGTRQLYIDKGYPSAQVYEEPLRFTFEGTTLTQFSSGSASGSFNGDNMIIDYGDGTIESTTGKFGHTYSENGTYQVKIYGITSLGQHCFRDCTGLTSINIPSSVTNLEGQCFNGCTSLTSINIPPSITTLKDNCFYNCANLTSINIPSSVTSLGVQCFSGCTSLISITIPDSVTSFGHHCFSGCTGLTSIVLPNNATSLANQCFYDCTGLTSINIPDSVTSLWVQCFQNCTSLTSITIPNNVTNLGVQCFSGCTSLISINIPPSVTNLGQYCFYNCTDLVDYYLNWTSSSTIITYNSNKMPNNTNTIFHVPEGTKQLYIDKGYPADKLREPSVMTLTVTGSSFETYSSTPFTYTGEVFVDWGDDSDLIEYTEGKLSHTFNDELNSHTVKVYGDLTGFGHHCFQNCTGLTSITIPDGVTSFRNGCFSFCSGLTSITIPNSVTNLGASCFYACTGLTSITIPDNITSLESSCFYGCSSLTSITLPDSITSLKSGCFYNCINLTSITIPNSVTNLENNCFYRCIHLTSIILNWTGTDILTYNSTWISSANSNLKFKIPAGTKQLYIDKGYPSDKLEEVGA